MVSRDHKSTELGFVEGEGRVQNDTYLSDLLKDGFSFTEVGNTRRGTERTWGWGAEER